MKLGDTIDDGGKYVHRWRINHPPDRDAITATLVRYDYDNRQMWYAALDDEHGLHWIEFDGGWIISPLLTIDAMSLREDTLHAEAERFASMVREAMQVRS